MLEKTPPITLLIIDEDTTSVDRIHAALLQDGLHVVTAVDAVTGFELFAQLRPRVVLVDLMMPSLGGMDVLEHILSIDPAAEVILVTSVYSTDSAVEAIRKGARDYLTKPLDTEKLRARITALLDEVLQRKRALQLELELVDAYQFQGMIGRSPLMLDVIAKVRRIAPHFRSVLVAGETGTGKELVARALHNLSSASAGQFAVCNCAAVVETLFESELFGHVKGSFTGATQDKVGLFEYANGGTVFLDEIGELPLAEQAKLLRVLQNQEVQRVGSPTVHKIDVRVIGATNRDLRSMAREGKFREDLYYRLGMAEIDLPRLADRKEDLPLLQRHFVDKYAAQYKKKIKGITRRAQACMSAYSWPGNIRELDNAIGLAAMMTEREVIDVNDLPRSLTMPLDIPAKREDHLETFEELQLRHLQHVMEHVGGDKTRAALILGISRSTLYNLLAKVKGELQEVLISAKN